MNLLSSLNKWLGETFLRLEGRNSSETGLRGERSGFYFLPGVYWIPMRRGLSCWLPFIDVTILSLWSYASAPFPVFSWCFALVQSQKALSIGLAGISHKPPFQTFISGGTRYSFSWDSTVVVRPALELSGTGAGRPGFDSWYRFPDQGNFSFG